MADYSLPSASSLINSGDTLAEYSYRMRTHDYYALKYAVTDEQFLARLRRDVRRAAEFYGGRPAEA